MTAATGAVTPLFLHGLDSSIQCTKARWLREHFPQVQMRDFDGSLEQRMAQLDELIAPLTGELVLVGSSFGGLMATFYASRHPERCRRLVLLAPALNFAGYRPPATKISVPTLAIMGTHDTSCPPAVTRPLAEASFSHLEVRMVDDDHHLLNVFPTLEWEKLLY